VNTKNGEKWRIFIVLKKVEQINDNLDHSLVDNSDEYSGLRKKTETNMNKRASHVIVNTPSHAPLCLRCLAVLVAVCF